MSLLAHFLVAFLVALRSAWPPGLAPRRAWLWAGSLAWRSLAVAGRPRSRRSSSARSAALLAVPDPAKTVTIHVHGWNLSGASKTGTVGDDRGGGDAVDGIMRFSGLPHGQKSPTATDQIVATEYHGSTLPSYYTAADRAEVMALRAYPLRRHRRKIRALRPARSGAEGVNLTCHSMGCLISRYLIENDVEHLASDGKLRRWVSFAGWLVGPSSPTSTRAAGSMPGPSCWALISSTSST